MLNGVSRAVSIDTTPEFVPNDAHSSVQAQDLARQLASEEQLGQALEGDGEPLIGAGTGRRLLDADRLASEYGGDPAEQRRSQCGHARRRQLRDALVSKCTYPTHR